MFHKVVEGGIGLLGVHIIRDDVDHDQAVLGGKGAELIVREVAVVLENSLGT